MGGARSLFAAIIVQHAPVRTKGEAERRKTKTNKSRRLPTSILLTAHNVAGTAPSSLATPSRSPKFAEPLKARQVADAEAVRGSGFPTILRYDLGHTQATLLLRRGVHPKIVADRLGHASTSTTLYIHSQVTPDMQDKALTELKEAPGGKKAG